MFKSFTTAAACTGIKGSVCVTGRGEHGGQDRHKFRLCAGKSWLSLRLMRGGLRVFFSILYTGCVLFHVGWCIRLTALIFFNHTL